MKPNHYRKSAQNGYSLVEVLVAITVLMIALVGPLTIANFGLQRAYSSREQTAAIFLAQEAIEGLVELRETAELASPGSAGLGSYNCTSGSPCGVRILEDSVDVFRCNSRTCDLYLIEESGRPKFQHDTSGAPTVFRREVVMDYANDNSYVYVESTVSWGSKANQQITLSTYLYDIYNE